ncbi:unnamed protein product [Closterium sp. NIES-53]
MYLMTWTRPVLVYPLSILARYVAPGRHHPEHYRAAQRVLRYLCSILAPPLALLRPIPHNHPPQRQLQQWETKEEEEQATPHTRHPPTATPQTLKQGREGAATGDGSWAGAGRGRGSRAAPKKGGGTAGGAGGAACTGGAGGTAGGAGGAACTGGAGGTAGGAGGAAGAGDARAASAGGAGGAAGVGGLGVAGAGGAAGSPQARYAARGLSQRETGTGAASGVTVVQSRKKQRDAPE